jgi:hypothetical protein
MPPAGRVVLPAKEMRDVRELVRTNDVVLVSAIGALLDGANIHHLVLDQNMSIIEGSIGMLPRRIMVHEDDNREARQILADAGLGHELRADD